MKTKQIILKWFRRLIVFPMVLLAFYCMTNSFSDLFLSFGSPGKFLEIYPSFMISLGIVAVAYGLWEMENWFRLKTIAKITPEPEHRERVIIRELPEGQ